MHMYVVIKDITCKMKECLCMCVRITVQILHRFATLGSDALIDPTELFSQCVAVNLLTQPVHDSLTAAAEQVDIEVLINCFCVVYNFTNDSPS